MKIKIKNVRISYPDIFSPGKKFGKFGAQFRFSNDEPKETIESALDEVGSETFKAKWPLVKKTLTNKGKLFRVNDGADKGYDEPYFISVHSANRPEVRGRKGEVIAEEDKVIYAGCRVDAILDVSAYEHKEFGSIVSVKLLGVQFRGDAEPYSGSVRADITDFEEITDDGEEL